MAGVRCSVQREEIIGGVKGRWCGRIEAGAGVSVAGAGLVAKVGRV